MKIFMILFFIFLHGCAHITTNEYLYKAYSEYSDKLNKQNVSSDHSLYFHSTLTKSVSNSNTRVMSQFLFHAYMHKELSHYEMIKGDTGCLTVNGIDSNKNMIAFYIEYKKMKEKWLILDINVSFIEKNENYGQKALCPNQTRVQ